MDIKSFVVALGGLILTGISLYITLFMTFLTGISIYITYRARTSPYREALYSKQLDGYVEIVNALSDVHKAAHGVFITKGLKLGKDAESELSSIAMNKYSDFENKLKKWVIVLPKEMNVLLANFRGDFERILDLPFENNPGKLFIDAYIEIIRKTRDAIRTESLSQETLELITKISEKEKLK